MKNLLSIILILLIASTSNAQIYNGGEGGSEEGGGCIIIENLEQTCNEDNITVAVSFDITLTGLCSFDGFFVQEVTGGISIGSFVSASGNSAHVSIPSLPHDTEICYDITTVTNGGLCQSSCVSQQICIETQFCDPCDDFIATIDEQGCGQFPWARILVSGGTPPYSGPGNQQNPGEFVVFFPGQEGQRTLVYSDSDGCTYEVVVDVPTHPLEINGEIQTTASNCDIDNGTASFTITGGTPPYNGPNNQVSTNGAFFYTNLGYGEHIFTITDVNGCEITFKVIIPANSNGLRCTDFNTLQFTETSINLGPFEIAEAGRIAIKLHAFCVPDRVVIRLNGNAVADLTAGTGGCGQPFPQFATDTICVSPCDVLDIQPFGNICPQLHGCPFQNTEWRLEFSCVEVGPCYLKSNSRVLEGIDSHGPQDQQVNGENPSIYPNPVSDEMTILNAENYKMARIMNFKGEMVFSLTENLSNKMDLSFLSPGLYILQLEDKNGRFWTQKFIKQMN